MKKVNLIIGLFTISLVLTSCGGSVKIDPNLSKEEAEAVVKTDKSLSYGDKIENYKVVRGKLPLAMLEPEFKSYRDKAYKAQLDYRACLTRGLNDAAQNNIKILQEIQDAIIEKSRSLESQSPEYIFVLADVKEKRRQEPTAI